MRFKNSSILGHDNIWEYLVNATQQKTLGACYLFVGPRHIGKETLARRFIQMHFCTNKNIPCANCTECILVKKKAHVLLFELCDKDGKSITIDSIRTLKKYLSFQHNYPKKRFVIIKDLACLSPTAANALLKILEEPPQNTIFIGITTNTSNILPTILSRISIINFYPVSNLAIINFLMNEYSVDWEKAKAIASVSDGKPGIAVRAVLDPIFYKDYIIKIKQLFKKISDDNGKLAEELIKSETKMTPRALRQHLFLLETLIRKKYHQQLYKPLNMLSKKEIQTKVIMLRVAKAYGLMARNISPSLIWDQIYCNI